MEIDENFILLKISQFEKTANKLSAESIATQGAADGLRQLLKEAKELTAQDSIPIEELEKKAEVVMTGRE